MDATSVSAMIGTFVGNVTTVLTDNIPTVLVITASLIGLGFMVRYARKFVK